MPLGFLLERCREFGDREALIVEDRAVSYEQLADAIAHAQARVAEWGLARGAVVSLEGGYTTDNVSVFLALVQAGCVVVPLASDVQERVEELVRIGEVEHRIRDGEPTTTGVGASHALYGELRARGTPGLVLFSSGTSGAPKGVVHDVARLVGKYHAVRHAKRTLVFFLLDHIGGVDTLLYTLSSGGCCIFCADRAPAAVCAAIERTRAEVLPVSPTFINMLLLSGALEAHDVSSLEIMTYGTEVMPEATLQRAVAAFPGVRMLQKFGMSEVGTLRSQSRSSDSTWVRVGGEGYETRVRDGLFEIKAESAMLGYLNAPSPWTEDGWLMTGDAVEVDGEYLRFLGRASDVINVGGEKFHPAAVEDVVMDLDGVVDAVVHGEANPLTGQMVVLRARIDTGEILSEFRRRLRAHCRDRLPPYMTPHRVKLSDEPLHGERIKRVRRQT